MHTSANPRPLGCELYVKVRQSFAEFAKLSPNAALWQEVLKLQEPPAELQHSGVVADEPLILASPFAAGVALGSVFDLKLSLRLESDELRLAHGSPGNELWDFAVRLCDEERLALDVLLRRALDPFEALATWPMETFFTPAEVDWLRRAPPIGPLGADLATDADRGSTGPYAGYACVIVKLTRRCNLRCIYCHDWRRHPGQSMPFIVQASLFQKLLGSPRHRTVDVVWHGGEPTLLGRREFLRLLALERFFLRDGQHIGNKVQTNATRLTSDWITFFKRYGFSVGTSIDGPAHIHDHTRPQAGARPSFAKVKRGIRLLQEANFFKEVLVVVGPELLEWGAERFIDFLKREGITGVGLLPVSPPNDPASGGRPFLARRVYGEFLLALHQAREASPVPWIRVRELDSALQLLRGGRAEHCEMLGNCVGGFFSIEPEGDVYHCDKFLGDEDFTLGNILRNDFDEMRSGEAACQLAGTPLMFCPNRETCRFFEYCRGGCPHEHYLAARFGPSQKDSACWLSVLFDGLTQSQPDLGISPPPRDSDTPARRL